MKERNTIREDADIMQLDKEELVAELNQTCIKLDEARHILEGVLDTSVLDPSDDELDDDGIDSELESGGMVLLALERMLDEVVEIIVEESDRLRDLSGRIEG